MKVLIVYPKMYVYGGAELLIVRLANYLSQRKIQNAILTTYILPEIEKDLINTQIISSACKFSKTEAKNLNPRKTLLFLNKAVRQNLTYFDVINVHNYPAELSTCPRYKPVVWMCNEPPDVAIQVRIAQTPKISVKRLFFKTFLAFDRFIVQKYIKNVVVADQFNEKRFINLYGFKPHIIHYGIDYDFFAHHTETTLKKTTRHFTVLHVGMLTPLKNQMESIKTIEKLKDAIPGIKLILAGLGEGQYLQSIREHIKNHQLDGHVEITGHLNREQIRALFHTCNVLLHPIKSQGGWLSPFEALCAGLPIVVSPEMTASNIVKRENLGAVTDDYAKTIFDIYQNPEKYQKMAVRRAAWVRDNLSWDNFFD